MKEPHSEKCGIYCRHFLQGEDTAGRKIDPNTGKLIDQPARKDLEYKKLAESNK